MPNVRISCDKPSKRNPNSLNVPSQGLRITSSAGVLKNATPLWKRIRRILRQRHTSTTSLPQSSARSCSHPLLKHIKARKRESSKNCRSDLPIATVHSPHKYRRYTKPHNPRKSVESAKIRDLRRTRPGECHTRIHTVDSCDVHSDNFHPSQLSVFHPSLLPSPSLFPSSILPSSPLSPPAIAKSCPSHLRMPQQPAQASPDKTPQQESH